MSAEFMLHITLHWSLPQQIFNSCKFQAPVSTHFAWLACPSSFAFTAHNSETQLLIDQYYGTKLFNNWCLPSGGLRQRASTICSICSSALDKSQVTEDKSEPPSSASDSESMLITSSSFLLLYHNTVNDILQTADKKKWLHTKMTVIKQMCSINLHI